jgi:hypothetical protein
MMGPRWLTRATVGRVDPGGGVITVWPSCQLRIHLTPSFDHNGHFGHAPAKVTGT